MTVNAAIAHKYAHQYAEANIFDALDRISKHIYSIAKMGLDDVICTLTTYKHPRDERDVLIDENLRVQIIEELKNNGYSVTEYWRDDFFDGYRISWKNPASQA